MDKKIYIQSNFILPSTTPKHPISKYIVRWDASIESYRVTLRQTPFGGHQAWKTYTPGHSQVDANQSESDIKEIDSSADTCDHSLDKSKSNEPAVNCTKKQGNTDVSKLTSGSAAQPTENDKPTSELEDTATAIDKIGSIAVADTYTSSLQEASPAPSPNTTCSTTSTMQELDSDTDLESHPAKSPVQVCELPVLTTPKGARSDIMQSKTEDDFCDSPIKPYELSRPCAPTPARARGMRYDPEDSLFESPVKACNIPRPEAPTPARGRIQYLDIGSDPEDDSCVIEEDVNTNDVFGIHKPSLTCDDTHHALPPLDRSSIVLSPLADALNIDFGKEKSTINPQVDWLDLASQEAVKEVFANYHLLSRKAMGELLHDAIESVGTMTLPNSRARRLFAAQSLPLVDRHAQDVEIDLYAAFGGQGATDLGDEDVTYQGAYFVASRPDEGASPVEEKAEESTEIVAYASTLLAAKTHGLPLSEFVPTGQKAQDALLTAFDFVISKGFSYNFEGAKLAASEVAYSYFCQGLDTLKRNGFVARQYPSESERSKRWSLVHRDSAALLPYHPCSLKTDMLRYTIRKPKKSATSASDSSLKHYNFFGDVISFRSTTPATVSLFVQMVAPRKPLLHQLSREGVIMSQANKYIDVVAYNGPEELLSLHGTAFQDQTTGYVVKVNDHRGQFGDLFDGESVIKSFEEIWDHYLIQDWQYTMQWPYKMDYEDQAHCGARDWNINGVAPTEFFRTRNAKGRIVHWDNVEIPKPIQVLSKLKEVQSVDGEDLEDELSRPREIQELSEDHELSAIVEEEGEEVVHPCKAQVVVEHQPNSETSEPTLVAAPAVNSSREDGCDSGYISEDLEAINANIQCKLNEQDDQEYSPLDLCIPGLRAVDEDWQPDEIPEDEALRYVDDLFNRACGGSSNIFATPENDSNIKETGTEAFVGDFNQFCKPPPEEIEGYKGFWTVGDENQQQSGDSSSENEEKQQSSRATTPPSPATSNNSTLSLSPISVVVDSPPYISNPIESKPTNDYTAIEAAAAEPSEKPQEEGGLSKYAATYAAFIFSASVVLSFW
ncbi:MAG: hypothetical protein Q9225_004110 [Loekoesia sp. 1 TL-2023]